MKKNTNRVIAIIVSVAFIFTISSKGQTNNNNMHALVYKNDKQTVLSFLTNKHISINGNTSQVFTFGTNVFGLLELNKLKLYNSEVKEVNQIDNVYSVIQGDYNQPFITVRKKIYPKSKFQSIYSDIPLDTYYFEAFSLEGSSISKHMNHNWYTNIAEELTIYAIDSMQESSLMPYFPLNDNVKWGVSDFIGNNVTPALYEAIKPFSGSIAAVKQNNKWGYINNKGKSIIACTYDYVKSWKGNYGIVMQNNKWGVINSKEEIILPFEYNYLKWGSDGCILIADSIEFSAGNMKFDNIARGSKWFLLDMNTNKKIDLNVSYIEYIGENRYVIKNKEEDNYFLLFDTELRQICTTRFQSIGLFSAEFAKAKCNNKWGVINIQGEWIVEPEYDSIGELF